MELADIGKTATQHFGKRCVRDDVQGIRSYAVGQAVHGNTPTPERIAAQALLAVPAQCPLETVAVRIDHAGYGHPAIVGLALAGLHSENHAGFIDYDLLALQQTLIGEDIIKGQSFLHAKLMHDLKITNARLYPMVGSAKPAKATCFAISDGLIVEIGGSAPAREEFDAQGQIILPGFIDCHTHALYAGDRMDEHRMKLEGASYEDIARAGGGILSTVNAVRAASVDDLVNQTVPRVTALLAEGVTTVEIKSGYGLCVEHELKMLDAIAQLGDTTPQTIVATFLGAHAVPAEKTREAYLQEVIDDMLPEVAARGLADTVDIFVENIGYTLDEMRALFSAAHNLGFKLRAHAEQLSDLGASTLACEFGALSTDHLEHTSVEALSAMSKTGCVAVLLPGAFYFLKETKKPPIEAMREYGVAMAVATDLNPGSSPVASLLICMHMAALMFGLTADEVLMGVTCHAARALGLQDKIGSLETGMRADFCAWDIPGPEFLVYQLGGVRPTARFINGQRL